MSTDMQETKKSSELTSDSSAGSLLSFDEFDRFFDNFLSRKWPRMLDLDFPISLERSMPKVDIIDHDNEIEIQAALPGIKKEDLDVTINNQTITIRASRKEEKQEEGKYFRREISRGEFQRILSLPNDVDNDKAKASFENGMLKITVPKTEKSKRKNIEIS